MVLMRFAFLLLLSGCAANQSAFPTAPPFSPAMDSPITIGHPGTAAPAPKPRSPYRRVLPETPETRRGPGIWASDGEPEPFVPSILDIPVPPTAGASEGAASAERRCVSRFAEIFFRSTELRERGMRHSKQERACIAAALLAECLVSEARTSKDSVTEALANAAVEKEGRACDGVFRDVVHFVNEVLRQKPTPSTPGGMIQ